jgi:hypothetical protein
MGLVAAGMGALAWRSYSERPGVDVLPAPEVAVVPEPGLEQGRTEVPASGQRTAQPGEAMAEPPATVPPVPAVVEEPRPARSTLALDLDQVARSFLTEQPRATELLDLLAYLATLAEVDPDAVTVQRGPEGELLSARGTLAIGDLAGTFLVDPDGTVVELTSELDDAAWQRCTVHVTFQGGDSGPRGCHAVVQFHPRAEVPAAGERDELVGWSVGTSAETGTVARPLTLGASGDTWTLVDSGRIAAQEFPWHSATAGFEAWRRLLEPFLAR